MDYAQINGDGICTAVSSLSEEVESDDMILLDYADYSLVGKRYDNGEWVDVPQPEPPLTEQEQIMYDTYLNTEYLVILQELEI